MKNKAISLSSKYEHVPGKIKTNMYEYTLNNHEKIMYWLKQLAKTPTCQEKFQLLEQNSRSYSCEEDLLQETYARILKTFYDNEQRLKACTQCKHQCKEFLNKTKKKNTEKFATGEGCRPYMFYNYSEKDFNNYINRSLKQNIDIKLKKLTDKNGKRIIINTEEKMGDSEDSCELGAFLSDTLSVDADTTKELTNSLMNKKLIFTHKIADFELLPDIFEEKDEFIEVKNDRYDENQELLKAEKRKIYEEYGLDVPPSLRPTPKTVKYNVGRPIVDLMEELNSRFNMINSFWEQDEFWKTHVVQKAEEEDLIKIGTPYSQKLRKVLENTYEISLDYVLADEDIRKSQYMLGESIENIKAAEECAKLDMISCLPTKEDLSEFLVDDFLEYKRYVHDWDNEEDIKMVYDEKTTEIKIVDKEHVTIPLPLCIYAEVSVHDFLDMCSDMEEGIEFFDKITAQSEESNSFKEFWVDFENKSYNIAESSEYLISKSKRKTLYRLARIARRMKGKNLDPDLIESQQSFLEPSGFESFSRGFLNKVRKVIKNYAINAGLSKYIEHTKILMAVPRKIKLTQKMREDRAREEMEKILDLRSRSLTSESSNINTSMEDTNISNLKPQELFELILERIPRQETQYIKEEVKVLCTSQSDNLKSVVSI